MPCALPGTLTNSTEFLNSAAVPHPRLLFLGDILAVPHAVPFANVYSIGDVCIAIGVAIAIHGLAGSRLVPRRPPTAAPNRRHNVVSRTTV